MQTDQKIQREPGTVVSMMFTHFGAVYSIFLLSLFTGTICDHLRAEILTSGVSKTLLNHSIACWPPAVVLQCVQLQPFGGDKGDMRRHNSRSLSQRVVSCQFVV